MFTSVMIIVLAFSFVILLRKSRLVSWFLFHIRNLNIVPQLVEHLHESLVYDAVLLIYVFLVINTTASTGF